ncbi:MAG: hypothetical protein KDC80_06885 [Saprospiraceae bacterium]|nr:hypothetical protein [Saprospiraceae bacterium]
MIDWFTVIAQLINFLILVYLLKRFLYQPILNAIDHREQTIEKQLKDAADLKSEAESQRTEYENKQKDLEAKKDELWTEIEKKAGDHRQALLKKAKEEYSDLRQQLLASLENEKEELGRKLKIKVKEHTLQIAAKVLEDLAGEELEDQMLTVFIQKINALPEKEIQELRNKMEKEKNLVITTAFDLKPTQKRELANVLSTRLGQSSELEFAIEKDVSFIGIKMVISGYQLEWSTRHYLDGLQEQVFNTTERVGI